MESWSKLCCWKEREYLVEEALGPQRTLFYPVYHIFNRFAMDLPENHPESDWGRQFDHDDREYLPAIRQDDGNHRYLKHFGDLPGVCPKF